MNHEDRIRRLLTDSTEFLSAQDVYAQLRSSGTRIGLTTVYRVLHTMRDTGQVDGLRGADGTMAYRACATPESHHHLVCRECGRTIDVPEPAIEKQVAHIATCNGYSDVTPTVVVFGRCALCRPSTPAVRTP